MKILVVTDSFKGSLSSADAGNTIKRAALDVFEDAEVCVLPVADGGEGTAEALSTLSGTVTQIAEVTGPLREKVNAAYCILPGGTAVIDMASAAGLTLVPEDKRNPLDATTYGVGELILDALKNGCRRFIIGIGGSATNDGGTGMLSALGCKFTDVDGNEIPCRGEGLKKLNGISRENMPEELFRSSFTVACDVKNPLCGENGCSKVFAKQKGATEEQIRDMDLWLEKYAEITKHIFPDADPDFPGSGAAGGLGFAFRTFLGGVLESGIDTVLSVLGAEEKIKQADLVITGEGKLDSQTAMGKAPVGIARMAKKYGKKIIAFAGAVSEDADVLYEHGIDAFFPVTPRGTPLNEALDPDNARRNLYNTALRVFEELK